VYDVIPHVRDGHEEVGYLLAVGWPFVADVPGVRARAGWASGGHQDLALVWEQVRQREGVPGTAAPPQCLSAHDREAEWYGGKRVGHDDLVSLVQNEVSGTG
jgi:hypothetical protein